ncbi:alpha-ketoglutarate-dependent dioxygenase AlkB [Novosphingobium terrae]|uniref:alpha-ketoglutarate-dependent dioxygenase AlkB n=1 Tax=Novosphingobium terrae TaxID=2726189 RepID=UPI002AC34810|nr:alpha-ketoglutarate-dependent dioxygenase AlkB [Novosphingobium terrae]
MSLFHLRDPGEPCPAKLPVLLANRGVFGLEKTVMFDLFDTQLIPGLSAQDGFCTPDNEAFLVEQIEAQALAPFRFQGWFGKRLTASFGFNYDFETAAFAPAEPIPAWLEPIRAQAAAFAGLKAGDLVQALLLCYDPGAGIGWHRDRPLFEHVIGISLGADTSMRFRRRTEKGFQRLSLPILSRSIYHLSGEARYQWEHSIADMSEKRWSITFRSLSARGRDFLSRGN